MDQSFAYSQEFEHSEGKLRVFAVMPGIARITYTKNNSFSTVGSPMLIQHNTPPVPFEREEDESSITLRTSQLTIKINRQSLACEYYDRSGFLLLSENQWRPREMQKTEVYRYEYGDQSVISQRTTSDGVRVDARHLKRVFDRTAYHTKLNFTFSEDEAIMDWAAHMKRVT
ncbi:MAG: DUF4968 domain-containing protein [Acetivibrionales bacterium]